MSAKTRKSKAHCCVVNCTNSAFKSPSEIHFYLFPVAPHKLEQRQQWINRVNRRNPDGSLWQPTKYSQICSQHFIGNEKSSNQFSPSYVPSIFPEAYQKKSTDPKAAVVDRFKRSMRRKDKLADSIPIENLTIAHIGSIGADSVNSGAEAKGPNQPPTSDEETQVNFPEQSDNGFENSKVFICNRYISENTSDSETQTYLPNEAPARFKHTLKKVSTAEKSCGSDITYVDKAVGPNEDRINSVGFRKCPSGFHGVTSITIDQEMLDLAGVTLHTFNLLLKVLKVSKTGPKISKENRLLIFLIKMKCGLTYSAIRVLFNIHRSTVSRIFTSTVQYLAMACRDFVIWPSKEIVQATMPKVFKDSNSDCRVIIDCTEIRVEQPSSVERRVQFYSHYEKGFTIKVLVGCTPSGLVSFVSKCYGGRISDSQLTNSSGFLDLLEPGDMILADKGFPGIKSTIDENGLGVLLVMPLFLHQGQFSEDEVNETSSIASVRIHIERIMQRLRIYRILTKFTLSMLPFADDILFMCAVLVNLQPPILKDSDSENV